MRRRRESNTPISGNPTRPSTEGDKASVIGNYDYQFPNGKQINGNVAEIWTAKDGRLNSQTIYFDTLTFATNLK
jgi:ketosteroid isomerase-like protein